MNTFKFRVSDKKFIGEDCAIVEVSGKHEIPVILLKSKNDRFPLDVVDVATNISNLLNGFEPVPLKAGHNRIYFQRQPAELKEIKLRSQEDGMNITKEGMSLRIYQSEIPEDIAEYVSNKILPDDEGTKFASSLCDSFEIIATENTSQIDHGMNLG